MSGKNLRTVHFICLSYELEGRKEGRKREAEKKAQKAAKLFGQLNSERGRKRKKKKKKERESTLNLELVDDYVMCALLLRIYCLLRKPTNMMRHRKYVSTA